MNQYTWTEIEWLWEQDKLTVAQAIEQLIQWGQKHHGIAVLCEHQMALQQREIQTLAEANIRWGVRVEQLEAEMVDIKGSLAALRGDGFSDMEV